VVKAVSVSVRMSILTTSVMAMAMPTKSAGKIVDVNPPAAIEIFMEIGAVVNTSYLETATMMTIPTKSGGETLDGDRNGDRRGGRRESSRDRRIGF
jgi:hypothetical protein